MSPMFNSKDWMVPFSPNEPYMHNWLYNSYNEIEIYQHLAPLQILYAYINCYLSTSISKCTYIGFFIMPDEYQRWKMVDLWWNKRRMLLPSTGRWQAWLKPLEFWCSKGTWGLLCYFLSFWLDVYFPVCASKQAVKISISFMVYSH